MAQPLCLAVDLGNTMIHMAVFEGENLLKEKKLPADQILSLSSWWEKNFSSFSPHISMGAIASVNPKVTSLVQAWMKEKLGLDALLVGQEVPVPIEVDVKRPQEVGVDRLVNAYMAYLRYKRSLLVVDFGTAITIDVVSDKGVYLGGLIAPGMSLCARALFEKTALLPLVQIHSPPQIIGKDTVEAISSGIYWGAVGMVELWVQKVSEELSPPPSLVLATGGDGALIARNCSAISKIDPYITLEGIARIAQNRVENL